MKMTENIWKETKILQQLGHHSIYLNIYIHIYILKCTISNSFNKNEQCGFIKQNAAHVPSCNTFTKVISVGYMAFFLSDSMYLLKFSRVYNSQIFMELNC